MDMIKNYSELATTYQRRDVLDIAEAGLKAIQPENVMNERFKLNGNFLKIGGRRYSLREYENIYLVGFGKGSGKIADIIYDRMGNKIREGYVIDNVPHRGTPYEFVLGSHPVPSWENFRFTENLFDRLENLYKKDLVLTVVCGGGSSMLAYPANIDLEKKQKFTEALLDSGAPISESNTMRKHLSKVKGGGLARLLYPSSVIGMIFSDVPGNDVSVIASGPTSYDHTTANDAWGLMKKYGIGKKADIRRSDLVETPKKKEYFENVNNTLMLTPMQALRAMAARSRQMGYLTRIYKDNLEGEARTLGKVLIEENNGGVLLSAGESTVKVVNKYGDGGRNRELVLGALPYIDDRTTLCSISTDGWDFKEYAGAIADVHTLEKVREIGKNIDDYLDSNDSGKFFKDVGGNIDTGKLSMNLSDFQIVLKK